MDANSFGFIPICCYRSARNSLCVHGSVDRQLIYVCRIEKYSKKTRTVYKAGLLGEFEVSFLFSFFEYLFFV